MRSNRFYAPLMVALLSWARVAEPQAPPPQDPSQFDVTGKIQAATLDTCAATDVLCGGTITINNQLITVPRNTILQMPAAAYTWQDVFAAAPAPYGLPGSPGVTGTVPQSGLALRDVPKPLADYEAHVVGNRVGNTYIAGLVFLSQHSLQSGQGFINDVDYTTGIFEVGGKIGVAGTGQRVKINDPQGGFGRAWTPDQRFTIDENNPTIRSETGYPMCIPSGPAATGDALCPQSNRPLDPTSPSGFAMVFEMPAPANVAPGGPDPRLKAPFEVGDYVTYSGILVADPAPATTTYVAAYQVIANVGLFTAPGSDPAYVATDVMLLGVGGNTTAGLTEATVRTRFEGFTTDPSRNILLYGVDVDPCTGAQTTRAWGSVDVDQGPPSGVVRGRWRFRPPNTVLSMPPTGVFLPATREMRAAIETAPSSGIPVTTSSGPGVNYYQAPIFEFLFPENANVGAPIVWNNFEDMPFLAQGSGPVGPGGAILGQLSPWPGIPAPAAAVCGPAAPVANAGTAQIVTSGAAVTLDGSLSTPGPGAGVTYAWTLVSQTGGAPNPVVLASNANPALATFTAPSVAAGDPPAVLTFQLTVTSAAGSSSANVTVTVAPPSTIIPVANAGANQTVASGTATVTLDGSQSTPVPGAGVTYSWTQLGGTPVSGGITSATTPTASFTPPTLGFGAPSAVLTFQLTVTSGAGSSSATTTVTVTAPVPPLDSVAVTLVEYRTGKQRLTVTATSTQSGQVPPPTLTMQAFDRNGVAQGKPQPMSLTGGAYTVIVVGAQQPFSVTVSSSFGGSATSGITRLRR